MTLLIPSFFALFACDSLVSEPPAPEDPCPDISMDSLPGEYLLWTGGQAEHTLRIKVLKEEETWTAWYVGGGYTKYLMNGEERAEDVAFTQVLSETEEARYQRGERDKIRIYFQPYKKRCAMRVAELKLTQRDGKETKRAVGSGYQEYVVLPAQYEFTFRPADETLFLGRAAKDASVAAAQLKRYGTAAPATDLGEEVPVGLWTETTADGPDNCNYTMDLFFDDQSVQDKQGLPVTTVKRGKRHWYTEWYAPYSGNHIFEMYRYRTCGGEKTLIAVAAIEAILN